MNNKLTIYTFIGIFIFLCAIIIILYCDNGKTYRMIKSRKMILNAIKDSYITDKERSEIIGLCNNDKDFYINFFDYYINGRKMGLNIYDLASFYELCPLEILYNHKDSFKIEDHRYCISFVIGMMGKRDVIDFFSKEYFINLLEENINVNIGIVIKALLFLRYEEDKYQEDLMSIEKILENEEGGNHPYRHTQYPILRALYERGIINKKYLRELAKKDFLFGYITREFVERLGINPYPNL